MGVSVPENSPRSRSDSSWPTRFHFDLELLRTTCSIMSSRPYTSVSDLRALIASYKSPSWPLLLS